MNVTTKVFLLKKDSGNLKAFASITLDEKIVITNIKVLSGKNGMFISFPQTKDANGDYHDIVFPLNKELRDKLTTLIVTEYTKLNKNNSGTDTTDNDTI